MGPGVGLDTCHTHWSGINLPVSSSASGEHRCPTDWHMLTTYNDLEHHDLEGKDPQELMNSMWTLKLHRT